MKKEIENTLFWDENDLNDIIQDRHEMFLLKDL